jgi:dephospho-CoA kinase
MCEVAVASRTGIAGYSGSGKSTLARFLAASGGIIIDADVEAKRFIAKNDMLIRQIIGVFGSSVAGSSGLNFSTLGGMVFSSPERLLAYNAIVHPPFLTELKKILDRQAGEAVILDAALIPLWGIESWFDECLWVHSSFAERVLRVQSLHGDRDPGAIENRLAIQEKVMKEPDGGGWKRIENEGGLEALERAAKGLRRKPPL